MRILSKEVSWVALALVAFSILGGLLILPLIADANPSLFAPHKSTAAATSTLAYMSPGAATTTLSYDSLDGETFKIDKLVLAFQYTASSTGPTLKVRLEDSRDGIDWYPRAAAVTANATTTIMTENFSEFSFRLATTTNNGGSGTSARVHQSFVVDAPLRHVRAVFYVPTSGGNGALWAQLIPVKEDSER